MSYTKTNYINGITPLNATNLNKQEIQTEKNTNDITALSNVIVQLDDKIKGHTHDNLYRKLEDSYNKQEIDNMIENAGSGESVDLTGYAKTDFVNAELSKKLDSEGHMLTDNNFTNSYKTKLEGLSNYTHPNDSNTRHVTDAEKSNWNNKANGVHTHTKSQITDFEHTHQDLLDIINDLKARIEVLESTANPKAPSFCGQMPFKPGAEITYQDLQGLINTVEVTKPQTVYAHSGATVYNKSVICAIPKDQGSISNVIDGANVDITAPYPINEVTINVPGIGNVVYIISANKLAQSYNSSVVVKFNLV